LAEQRGHILKMVHYGNLIRDIRKYFMDKDTRRVIDFAESLSSDDCGSYMPVSVQSKGIISKYQRALKSQGFDLNVEVGDIKMTKGEVTHYRLHISRKNLGALV